MPGIEIKGRSKIANYRHGGRTGHAAGGAVKVGKKFLDFIKSGKYVDKKGVKINVPKAAERIRNKDSKKVFKSAEGKAAGGRAGYSSGKKVVKARDINKSGSIEGWEKARAKGMAKGMGATFKAKSGGRAGYRGGRRVGGGKSMSGLPTPIRLSLVNKKKEELKKG